MQILRDFRYYPLRIGSVRTNPEIAEQFPGRIIAFGNYTPITRRSQFWDKIAWFATKRAAQRRARLYHRRLPSHGLFALRATWFRITNATTLNEIFSPRGCLPPPAPHGFFTLCATVFRITNTVTLSEIFFPRGWSRPFGYEQRFTRGAFQCPPAILSLEKVSFKIRKTSKLFTI
jgi:hypothetical protein